MSFYTDFLSWMLLGVGGGALPYFKVVWNVFAIDPVFDIFWSTSVQLPPFLTFSYPIGSLFYVQCDCIDLLFQQKKSVCFCHI